MDHALAELYAEYVRGGDGVALVLNDALLERGEQPLPEDPDAGARIERVMARMAMARQLEVGCASVRRLVATHAGAFPDVAHALAALERGELRDDNRHAVFAAWRACADGAHADAARVIWAVWMLLREMPSIALRTVRAIDARELANQIELVATTLTA